MDVWSGIECYLDSTLSFMNGSQQNEGKRKKKHEREWRGVLFLLLPSERKGEKMEKKLNLTLEQSEHTLKKMKARWLRNIVWERKGKMWTEEGKGKRFKGGW